MEFFVEIDRETIKRIVVNPRVPPRFTVTISLLLDEGREVEISAMEIDGNRTLQRLLRREGVPPEELAN